MLGIKIKKIISALTKKKHTHKGKITRVGQ